MSQGNFGNLCDTDNFGDPVVLYDTFEDRWILTDFAFQLDGGGAVINPPGSFQCFAVSKTSDPVAGGWNFYSVNTVGGLGDYPKFGVWTDGLYMTTSIFDYAAGGAFQNPRAYAFNKAQMYAGAPTVQIVSFNLPAGDFTVLPSNARLQTGTPPAGSPNYYVSSWMFLNALSVYKFHVDWDRTTLSTFSAAARAYCRNKLAERISRERASIRNGPASRQSRDPRDDAEPVYEYRRRRISLEHAHRSKDHYRFCRSAVVSANSCRWDHFAEYIAGGNMGPRWVRCYAPIYAEPCSQPSGQYGDRLQYLQQHDLSVDQICGSALNRSGKHVQPDRADHVCRNGLTNLHQSMGRLQCNDGRSGWVHILVHKPVCQPGRADL